MNPDLTTLITTARALLAEYHKAEQDIYDLRMSFENLGNFTVNNLALFCDELEKATTERDENHRMWAHWQNQAVKCGGSLDRTSKVAKTYEAATALAIKQRDEACVENACLTRALAVAKKVFMREGYGSMVAELIRIQNGADSAFIKDEKGAENE